MSDTRVTIPFNRKYLPGENTTFSKIAISAVVPGSATVIATEKNHGLYGNLDVITVYDNGTSPFLNFIEYPATVIDGRRFTIPVDTTNYTTLCSNGYIVKRSSIVGPVRKKQNYNDVALSITPVLDRYIIIEKAKNDFGVQTEVDVSLLGVPREEETSTQIEEVTKYGLNSVIWQERGWHTFWRESAAWHLGGSSVLGIAGDRGDTQPIVAKYIPEFDAFNKYYDYYRGRGITFIGSEACLELFTEIPAESAPYFRGPILEPWYPGLYPAGYAYQMLETQRSFKYLPGRANVFTFGIRAIVDNANSITDDEVKAAYELAQEDMSEDPPGNIARWGVGNRSDAYYFELSGNGRQGELSEVVLSVNRRRHYRGDSKLTSKRFGTQTDFNQVQVQDMFGGYPDDAFYCVSRAQTKFVSIDPDAPELTKVFQKDFGVDKVDGTGPSKAKLDPSKVTMYKIEFSWYGAAGARFFAYLNTGNNKAEWVCLHEIEGGQTFKEPVLTSPVMQIKYFAFSRAGGRVSLKKYGVSSYIEGADEGTMVQSTRYSDILKEVNKDPIPLVGITTTDAIKSSFNEFIPNSKIILPSLINVSTSENCLVEIVWKPTSNLVQGITQGPELQPLNVSYPTISGTILRNNPLSKRYLIAASPEKPKYPLQEYPIQQLINDNLVVDETANPLQKDDLNYFELSGAYNLRALTGNFGITGPAAKEALVGARIYDSVLNTVHNRFQYKWWDPKLVVPGSPPGTPPGGWSDAQLPPGGDLTTNNFIVPGFVNAPRVRTAIFNTYISAVGDFDPTKGPDEWFKTCNKGDVIWLTSPLSGWANMNLFNANAPGGIGLGQETGVTGPFVVWDNHNNIQLPPPEGTTGYGHAFVSVYPYVTGSAFEFNIEILDRQAVSNEVFTGKDKYWVTCNLGKSFAGPKRTEQYYATTPTCEGYIGRYFLRNYVRSIGNIGGTGALAKPTIKTELPHLLEVGETFTYVHATEGTAIPTGQLAGVNDRVRRYTVSQIISADEFVIVPNFPLDNYAPFPNLPPSNVGVAGKIYILKERLPNYIPLNCINFVPYPYRSSAVKGRIFNGKTFPDYGLPIDRVSMSQEGGPTVNIYPRGFSTTALQNPWYDPFNSTAFQLKNTKYKEFTYQSKTGTAFAHTTATNTHMSIAFPDPQSKVIDNVNRLDSTQDGLPRGTSELSIRGRDAGEPWRLVFVGHKGSSIRDAIVVSDYWTQDQQAVSPNWIALSSTRFAEKDPLTGKMLSGVPGLSCVYPGNSDALRQCPNFITPKDIPGTAVKLDFQSSQPLYYKDFISSAEIQAGLRNSQMAPRTIAAFYVPKGDVVQLDVSSYFGLVAEYISNTLKNKEMQPWNAVYVTARTVTSAVDTINFIPKDIAATGYNENGQFSLAGDFDNKYNFTTFKQTYRKIAAGDRHLVVIDKNDQAFVAGSNSHGQLGLPLAVPSVNILRPVQGFYRDVVCGNNNTFLLSAAGNVWCVAGENTRGQLAQGHTFNVTEFTPLTTTYTGVVAGSAHTFARITNSQDQSQWYCTGDNTYGQLGTGVFGGNYTTFQPLEDLSPTQYGAWKDIVCGDHHTVALISEPLSSVFVRAIAVPGTGSYGDTLTTKIISLSTHKAYSCGLNNNGQLGLGDNNNRSSFTEITALGLPVNTTGWTKLAARGNHTLALSSDYLYHALYATGNNQYGQLGLNTYQNYNQLQRVLVTNKDLDAICGKTHTAILCGTSLFTAGDNLYGQLGLSAERDIISVIYPGFDESSLVTVPGGRRIPVNAIGVIQINWATPTAGLSSLFEDQIVDGKKSYTGVIGNSSVRLYWSNLNTRWELFNLTTGRLACTGNNENLFTSTWVSPNNGVPRINTVAQISANKDNTFKLSPGQPLPLSGSSIYCETFGPNISAYLSQDATFVRKLVLTPAVVYPKAKVYAGITWREQ